MNEIKQRYVHYHEHVRILYLHILNGHFISMKGEELDSFVTNTINALAEITDKEIVWMYNGGEWRDQITASWLCGLGQFQQHIGRIGDLLLASPTCYAGQMHFFAMARFKNKKSHSYLVQYLDKYLPIDSRQYDQLWAIGALKWLDERLNKSESERFMRSPKNWQQRVGNRIIAELNPNDGIINFKEVMRFVEAHFSDEDLVKSL